LAKAPSMDGREQRALARVCGDNIDGLPEGSGRAPAFAAHLLDVTLPSTWHAADGVAALQDAGALRDWGRLVALYPGW
jgi:hypothetical protein